MCSPAAAVIVMAGGMLYQSSQAIEKAKATNAAAEYNAQMMERNAKLAEQEALWIEEAGRTDIAKLKLEVSQLMGSQRSSFSGSGAVVDSGSTAHVLEDTEQMGIIDAMTLERNSAREAWSKRKEAQGYRYQAGLSRMGKVDPYQAGFTTLLTGATSAATSFAAYGMNSKTSGNVIVYNSKSPTAPSKTSMSSANRFGYDSIG